jgi:hypothetical protein
LQVVRSLQLLFGSSIFVEKDLKIRLFDIKILSI